ncbi:MAG: DUF2179 domain-containing protein [Syntrophomonadaceae bacterium]|mgnify:CR=1 FL=1|nr:DUF2179 domain-containing protein [Syntrophomonadaceae bacterium]
MFFDLAFIFFARIIDVSLGTVRMILTIKGDRYRAALIGFIEIFVYVVALSKVIGAFEDPLKLALYCLGFACGIIVGSWMEELLALGHRGLQVTINKEHQDLVDHLRDLGYAVTIWEAQGREGPKIVMNLVVRREMAGKVEEFIREADPQAFIIFLEPKNFSGGFIKKK